MPNARWKDKANAGTLTGTEKMPITLNGGQDRHVTPDNLKAHALAGAVAKHLTASRIFYGTNTAGEQHNYTLEELQALIPTGGGGGGADGLSAYQIAVQNGYSGTVTQWLASLVGANGKSAFQLAQEGGFAGTQAQWLASLVGAAGAAGQSAYQIAVSAGFSGSQAQWLASLVGSAGAVGKSAYTLAVEGGFSGTQAEWLASLVGAPGAAGDDGAPGKSAYEIALDNGLDPEITEAQWLESFGGLPPTLAWGPEDLGTPPELWIDADDPSLYTLTANSRVIAALNSKFNAGTMTMTPLSIMLQMKAVPFNGRRAFAFPGTGGNGKITFTGSAANLGRNKSQMTLFVLGRFLTDSTTTTGGGVPLIYLGTPSADTVRTNIARSSVQANILRYGGRRNDGDTFAGLDVGGNMGSSVFMCIAEFDYLNTTTRMRINGVEAHERTDFLTAGSTSNTAPNYNGIGSSSAGGTTTPWEMNCAGVAERLYTEAEIEKIEGFFAWKLRMAELLPDAHPYRNEPPTT